MHDSSDVFRIIWLTAAFIGVLLSTSRLRHSDKQTQKKFIKVGVLILIILVIVVVLVPRTLSHYGIKPHDLGIGPDYEAQDNAFKQAIHAKDKPHTP